MGLPNIRVNFNVPFPAQIAPVAGPIYVTKANGKYTVGLDLSLLGSLAPPPADFANDYVLWYSSSTKQHSRASFNDFAAAIGSVGRSITNPSIFTTAGTHAMAVADVMILLNYGAPGATTIDLCAVASRSPAGSPLYIFDWNGNAGDITLVPSGTDKIMGVNANFTLASGGVAQSGAAAMLIPSTDLSGWLVK